MKRVLLLSILYAVSCNPAEMPQKNYYEILGVAQSATLDEIKQAYRKLTREYHPDAIDKKYSIALKNEQITPKQFDQLKNNAIAHMKAINTAYEVLSDQRERSDYDRDISPSYRQASARSMNVPAHKQVGDPLEEDLKGIERFYTYYPKTKSDDVLTKKILTDLMEKFNFTTGKELQYVVERLEKLPGMQAFKDINLKKWIGEQKKRLFLENELRSAVASNDLGKVKNLIAKGVNVNARDRDGLTALYDLNFDIEAMQELGVREQILLSLIRAGANPNLKGYLEFDLPVLHWYILAGFAPSVKILLDNGALIHNHDLEVAIRGFLTNFRKRQNYRQILTMLLEKGVDPNILIKEVDRTESIKNFILKRGGSDAIRSELLDLLRKHGLKE